MSGPPSPPTLAQVRGWLAGLGCQVAVADRGGDLRGEFSPPGVGALMNPASGATIDRVRFAVDPEGALRLTEPACVRELPARSWRLVRSLGEWCAEIQSFLDKRLAEAEAACEELRGRGLDAEVDLATLEAGLELSIEGLGFARLACAAGLVEGRWLDSLSGRTRSLDTFSCRLGEVDDLPDLELRICEHVKRDATRADAPSD